MNTCPYTTHCWFRLLFGLVWLLVSSGLVYFSWNKVVTMMTKMKALKYWQVLLVMVTICSFFVPCYLRHRYNCQKRQCPYSHHDCDHDDDEAPAKK